jgi:hypothetical protein
MWKTYIKNLPTVGIAIALIALLPFPTDFYLITRLGICLTAGLLAYRLYSSNPEDQKGWWVLLAACAVFYNPIFPIYLHERIIWMIINVLTAVLFWHSGRLLKQNISKLRKSKVN